MIQHPGPRSRRRLLDFFCFFGSFFLLPSTFVLFYYPSCTIRRLSPGHFFTYVVQRKKTPPKKKQKLPFQPDFFFPLCPLPKRPKGNGGKERKANTPASLAQPSKGSKQASAKRFFPFSFMLTHCSYSIPILPYYIYLPLLPLLFFSFLFSLFIQLLDGRPFFFPALASFFWIGTPPFWLLELELEWNGMELELECKKVGLMMMI